MMHSFYLSLNKAEQDVIVCYSDIYFKPDLIKKIIKFKNKKNIFVPVLKNWKKIWKIRDKLDKNDAEELKIDKNNNIIKIGQKIKNNSFPNYQFMGIVYIPYALKHKVLDKYKEIKNKKKLHTTNFLNHLIKKKLKLRQLNIQKNGMNLMIMMIL